jgi:hypothetical protein
MMENWTPHLCLKSIYDLPCQEFWEKGYRILFCDLDNTVSAYDKPFPEEKFLRWVENRKNEGWEIYILSNNGEERVKNFCEEAKLTGFSNLYKPLPFRTRQIAKELGASPNRIVFIGDQVFTDVWLANQMGFLSVLVDPVAKGDLLKTKINRKLEGLIRKGFVYGKNKSW